jgi:cysteinyl-tRNA synthetase
MSKSLGNFMLLRDLVKDYEPNVIRLLMLQTHYRSPLDFSDDRLKEARTSFERIQTLVDRAHLALEEARALKAKHRLSSQMFPGSASTELQSAYRASAAAYILEMDDDFNTAGAVGQLFELVRSMNVFLDAVSEGKDAGLGEDEFFALEAAYNKLVELFAVLGLTLTPSSAQAVPPEAEALLEERNSARAAKDWTRADEIRDELAALGFEIKDTAQGPQLIAKAD